MKKLLIAFLLLVFSPIYANGWLQFEKNADGSMTHFIDTRSIEGATTKRVWTYTNFTYPANGGILSYKNLWELDCKKKVVRYLHHAEFREKNLAGPPVTYWDGVSPWTHISPDSVSSTLKKIVCREK